MDDKKLNLIKKRDISQKILETIVSFKTLRIHSRVPQKYKKEVRRSKETTYIYPNTKSFRIVAPYNNHYYFLRNFNCIYSTSANKTNQKFDFNFAKENVDVIVFNKQDFYETNGSKIFKVSNSTKKKIR